MFERLINAAGGDTGDDQTLAWAGQPEQRRRVLHHPAQVAAAPPATA